MSATQTIQGGNGVAGTPDGREAEEASRVSGHRTIAAAGTTSLGDGATRAVLPLVATSLSGAPWAAGLLLALARIPWFLVSLPAGRHADLHGYRGVATAGLVVKLTGAATLVLALALGSYSLGALAAFLLVSGEVAFETATQTSLVRVFRTHERTRRNGHLFAWQSTNGQFIGPSIGGALYGAGGYVAVAFAFVVHTLTFVVRAPNSAPPKVDAAAVPAQDEAAGEPDGYLRSLTTGFRPLFATRALAGTTMIGMVSMLAYGMWGSVFVLYVTSTRGLDLDAWAFGLLMACPALGSLPTAMVASRLVRRVTAFGCVVLMVAGQIGLFLPAAVGASSWFVVLGLVCYGTGLTAWNSGVLAFRQQVVPTSIYGRVTSAYRVATWGASPLGALLGAVLATCVSIQLTFLVGASLVLTQVAFLPLVGSLANFTGTREA